MKLKEIQEIAMKDWASLKDNKIYNYEIMKKMEESPEYKKEFQLMFELQATQLLERGYKFDMAGGSLVDENGRPNFSKYAANAIENLITNAKNEFAFATPNIKAAILRNYNEKYPVGFTNDSAMHLIAIEDYNKTKTNKISEPEIAIKMERNEIYKEAFERLCENSNMEYMASKNIPLDNKEYYEISPGGLKLNSINMAYKNLLQNTSQVIHKQTIFETFERDHGEQFIIPVSDMQAIKDYNDSKNNKISFVIINDRMENSIEYLKSYERVAQEDAKIRVNDYKERDNYVKNKIEYIKNSSAQVADNIKTRIRQEYKEKFGSVIKTLNKFKNVNIAENIMLKEMLKTPVIQNQHKKTKKLSI